VGGERVVLFGKESRRRNLFTLLGQQTSRLAIKRTSVIAGHGMPERSKGRTKPDDTISVSDAAFTFGVRGELFTARKERG
jgi:hypothetical protein